MSVHITDWILGVLYLIIIYILFLFIKGKNIQKHHEYRFFITGLTVKIVGALAFALVYIFYYKGGDTMNYFWGGETLVSYLINDPRTFLRLMFSSADFPDDLKFILQEIAFARAPEEWLMVRITAIINLFSFNRYLLSTLLIALISFWGSWRMYQTFLMFHPNLKKIAFYAVFLTPSVVFWGSGILKDTISFAFLGLFFYHSAQVFYFGKRKPNSLLIVFVAFLVIFNLKAYIILSFLPVLLIAWIMQLSRNMKNKLIRRLLTPIIAFLVLGVAIGSVPYVAEKSEKYRLENLESRMKGFHSWHTTVGGSTYDLHVTDYSLGSIAAKIPAALNVTYYRPYPLEVNTPTMAMGAVESLLFLILSIVLIIVLRVKFLSYSTKSPLMLISFLYAIIFGFAVGFTSYNFGALGRYKIPAMPFFAFYLFYLYFHWRKQLLKKRFKRTQFLQESQ
ncbi:MAG: hypothetical protein JXR60_01785 [Bacteroidales bacterium]|nr:hypothetical protein [Bacteroidales bacterium]